MEITIQKRELSGLRQRLEEMVNVKDTTFAFVLNTNIDTVENLIEKLNSEVHSVNIKDEKLMSEVTEFENNLREKYPEFCSVDASGNSVLTKKDEWEKYLSEMKIGSPDAGAFYDSNVKRIDKLLLSNVTVDIKTIPQSMLPSSFSLAEIRSAGFMIAFEE